MDEQLRFATGTTAPVVTVKPTMELRLYGSSMDPINRKLQQLFLVDDGKSQRSEWRDVPLVEAPREQD